MKRLDLVKAFRNDKIMGDSNTLESQLSQINWDHLDGKQRVEFTDTLMQLYDNTRIDICV